MARRQEQKRAVPFSSDSNLDVNCRLMSQWSGVLLGDHSGIQENKAKKPRLDRCTTEPLNRAIVLSALSILHTTEHGRRCTRWRSYKLSYSTSLKFNLKLQLWGQSSCYCQQRTLFSFFSPSLCFSHAHTPYKCIPTLILILLFHLFLFLSALSLLFCCTATSSPSLANFWAPCHSPILVVTSADKFTFT